MSRVVRYEGNHGDYEADSRTIEVVSVLLN
jgi:hypothetical protein